MWAVYSLHLLIFGLLSLIIGPIIWTILKFADFYVTVAVPWLVLWCLFALSIAFTRIELTSDGITVQLPLSKFHFKYADISSFNARMANRIVYLGFPNWGPKGYWIVFKGGNILVENLRKYTGREVAIKGEGILTDIAILLLPILFITTLEACIGLYLLDPLLHSSLWAVTSSVTVFYYTFKRRAIYLRFGKLGRFTSSLMLSLTTGILIFYFTLALFSGAH
ncbi:MAG: hypothetical protein QXU45_09185 [Candidatus Bathyarchaeia archaeon]